MGAAFSAYTASGFTVSPTAGSWTVDSYGNPGPSIVFWTAPSIGTIQVTAGGAAFSFTSVDLYSGLSAIPYSVAGLRSSAPVFTFSATLTTTGGFVTVVNPQAAAVIDTLIIGLSNPAIAVQCDNQPCTTNPVGVDNIVVTVP
jgi:hypothetical protein